MFHKKKCREIILSLKCEMLTFYYISCLKCEMYLPETEVFQVRIPEFSHGRTAMWRTGGLVYITWQTHVGLYTQYIVTVTHA